MQDRPTATELLTTVADLLETDVMPACAGPLQHQVRVAGNLCRILIRELDLGGEQERREVELLTEALGLPPAGGGERNAHDLSQLAVDRLRREHHRGLERGLYAALVEIVRGKLAIAKPGHDGYDFESELVS